MHASPGKSGRASMRRPCSPLPVRYPCHRWLQRQQSQKRGAISVRPHVDLPASLLESWTTAWGYHPGTPINSEVLVPPVSLRAPSGSPRLEPVPSTRKGHAILSTHGFEITRRLHTGTYALGFAHAHASSRLAPHDMVLQAIHSWLIIPVF